MYEKNKEKIIIIIIISSQTLSQDDRDNLLTVALEGYKRCLVVGDKHDVRVVCT